MLELEMLLKVYIKELSNSFMKHMLQEKEPIPLGSDSLVQLRFESDLGTDGVIWGVCEGDIVLTCYGAGITLEVWEYWDGADK